MSDTHAHSIVVEVLVPGPQGPSGVGTDNIGGYSVNVEDIDVDHTLLFDGTVWRNRLLASGGDMLKAIYDSQNDGKVDVSRLAESVSWNNITTKPASFTPTAHTHTVTDVTGLSSTLNTKAPLASPVFTGTPTAPTASSGTNTTQIATTAFVTSAVAAVTPGGETSWNDIYDKPSSFPPSVHTHILDDVTGLSTALDTKAPNASPVLTGTPTAPTASAGTNTTQLATTAFVAAATAKNVAVITTSGNFTVPAGIRSLDVQLWGGGGGGGGVATAGQNSGGGGGGGYCRATIQVTPGQVIAAVVGAGGTGGGGSGAGGAGGTTSFAALSATGGDGGNAAPIGLGGAGGSGSGGTINLDGASGGTGQGGSTPSYGGGGGGAPLGGAGGALTLLTNIGSTPGGGASGRGAAAAGIGPIGGAGLIIITY